jgi:hypothetical protein
MSLSNAISLLIIPQIQPSRLLALQLEPLLSARDYSGKPEILLDSYGVCLAFFLTSDPFVEWMSGSVHPKPKSLIYTKLTNK